MKTRTSNLILLRIVNLNIDARICPVGNRLLLSVADRYCKLDNFVRCHRKQAPIRYQQGEEKTTEYKLETKY
jgi:hypothetical protein